VKVLVLGSGVIGVTSAYYLAKAGHEVTVVDRQGEPARETSFANAGEVSPGYSSPWAGPGVPVKAIKWLLMRHGPLVIWPKLDPVMWWWMLKMLRNCTAERYAINKSRMIPIAEYSRDCLRALRAETSIHYDERSRGTLQLFRKQAQLDHTAGDIAVLKQYGVPYEVLDRAGCIAAEPALAVVEDKFVGGTAEISGYSDRLDAARRATLDHSLTDMFPRGGDLGKAIFWCGLRPMTPDGPPVIGATRYANLHLNTGHGTLGWTMACGSGHVLADLLSGRKPDIDASELTLARYDHRFG